MSTERNKILQMLEQGKITASEASALLDALQDPDTGAVASDGIDLDPPASSPGKPSPPRYLFVKVEPGPSASDDEIERINLRIPLAILRAGVKLDAVLPGAAGKRVTGVLSEHDVDLNLKGLDDAAIEDFILALADLQIDVVDGKQQIRLWAQ